MVNPVSSGVRTVVSPNAIINQKRHTLYYLEDDEMLCATATTCLVAVENEKLLHWENNTKGKCSHELEYTIGCKSHTSTALSEKIALHDTLKNVEVNGPGIYKKFLPEEVLPERRLKTRVSVPGYSNFYFYQRKYVLETEVYFTHDAWSLLCVVVSNCDHIPRSLKILTTIHSAEFITTDEELRGVTEMEIVGQTKEAVFGRSERTFIGLTERAKVTLKGLGVTG